MLGQHLSQNMRNFWGEKFKNFFRISIFILCLVLESAVMITIDASDSQKYMTIQKGAESTCCLLAQIKSLDTST